MVTTMGNRLKSLYLALLNVHYGWSAGKYYYFKKKQRIWEPLVLVVALAPAAVMAVWFLWSMTDKLFLAGLAFGQPHLSLAYGALMVAVLTLFFGFFYVLSAFYFSSDLEILVPLPFKSWEILVAKLGVVLTGQYVINTLLLLPIWIRYGLLAGVGVDYVLSALVVFLTLPILPLVLASLFTVVLMRFTNLSRHKDRLTLIGGILLVVVVLGFQLWMQNNIGDGDPEAFLEQVLIQTDGLVRIVGRVFPTSVWAAQAMAYSYSAQGWLRLFYLVLASAVGLGVLYLLGERVFLQGVVAGLEGSKQGTSRAVDWKSPQVRPAFWTLVNTEIRLFVRDPGFALNGLIGYILLPVMAILPLFAKNLSENPFEFLTQQEWPPLLLIGGVALFFMVMTSMSMIPTTTFSREGKYLWIIRSMPLSIQEIIFTRVVASQIVNTLGCLLGLLPAAHLFGWSVFTIIIGTLLGVFLATALACLLIILDLSRPMLDWVNPIKAVKSNLNAIVGLFGSMLLTFGLGALFYWNFQAGQLWLVPLELLLACAVLAFLGLLLLSRFAPKQWQSIEGGI